MTDRPRRSAALAALLLGLWIQLLPAPAAAGTAQWQPASLWGGDVKTLAFAPDDADVVFAGTSGGQVYVSHDAGAVWRNAGPFLPFPGWVVSHLAFDPNRPRRMWAALRGMWGSGHVAFSDDRGKSWVAASAGLPDEPVYTLALVPGREGRLYAATLSGVWGSTDDGGSWRRLTAALPEVQKVTSLLVEPGRPDTVIAGTWRQAYKSEDGGRTWAGVFEGMVLDSEVFSLTPIPGRPGEIWATTCGWVYRTLDGGGRWERFKDGFAERRTPSFAALPDGRLLAGTVAGLHASTDGGRTWKRAGDPALSIQAIAFHPLRPSRLLLATEGAGVWATDGGDGGKLDFRRASKGMTNTRIGALAVAPAGDGGAGEELIVAVNHAGPLSGIRVSRDGGRGFEGPSPVPTVLDLAVHEGRAYAATERGLYRRLGLGWHRVPELGERRVEQVLADGGALVARTADALFELVADKLVERAFQHGAPRSAALAGDALWVSDGKGIYRLTRDANDTVPAPMAAGRLGRLADRLLLWGPDGAWTRRSAPGAMWVEIEEKPTRVLATGDARRPALLIAGEALRLFDTATGTFEPVDVPVPARDVIAAVLSGGRLYLGTSGYGVLMRDLAGLVPAAAPSPQAGASGG